MQDNPGQRGPSEATLARRDTRNLLAPFVANLSGWHHQAARVILEVDRAVSRGDRSVMPTSAIDDLIAKISQERDAFAASTAAVESSRVDDVERSFSRLLSDLQRARQRCGVTR